MLCEDAVYINADTHACPQAMHTLVQEGPGKKGGIVWTEFLPQDLEKVCRELCTCRMNVDMLFREKCECQATLKPQSSINVCLRVNGDEFSVIGGKVSCACPRAAGV